VLKEVIKSPYHYVFANNISQGGIISHIDNFILNISRGGVINRAEHQNNGVKIKQTTINHTLQHRIATFMEVSV